MIRSFIGRLFKKIVSDRVLSENLSELATLERIRSEYDECVEKFVKERDFWKNLFIVEWKQHLNAQRILEKNISRTVELTKIAVSLITDGEISDIRTFSSTMSSDYESAMMAIERNHLDEIDGLTERNALREVATKYSSLAGTSAVNGLLFNLISRIELERNKWLFNYREQASMHLDRQAALETMVHASVEQFRTVLSILNRKRADSGKSIIKTEGDLREAVLREQVNVKASEIKAST